MPTTDPKEIAERVDAQFVKAIVLASSGAPGILTEQIEEFNRLFPEQDEFVDYYREILLATGNYWAGRCDEAERQFSSLLDSELKVNRNVRGLVHMMAGGNYRSVGEFEKAVSNLLKAREMIDPQSDLAAYAGYARYQLGEIHVSLSDYEEAEQYFRETVEISIAAGNPNAEFRSRSGLGGLLVNIDRLDDAQIQLDKAMDLASAPGQKGRVLHDLSALAEAQEDYKKAEEIALDAFSLRMNHNLSDAASTSQILMARCQLNQGKREEAIKNLNEAIVITKKYAAVPKEMEAYRLLALAYEEEGQFEKAFSFLKKHTELSRSLNSDQQREIYKLKNSRIREQKKEIEDAHDEIQDSIAYAKRIQSAILPPDKIVQEFLPNSFILYKPKDVVAGDFYWLEPHNDKVLFAAADCTGHGVPGAMVSVICNSGLNRSVREYGLTDPGRILDQTRDIVIQEFEKSEEEVKDGMDIALVSLEGRRVQYAGAYNAFWLIRNGSDEVEEVKADKQPIGLYSESKPFTTHSLELNKGDTFYLYSDGYADQFGGPKGKKFKAANFKKLLVSIQDKQMSEQRDLLDQAFEEWRGETDQIDDVCVIGVRI